MKIVTSTHIAAVAVCEVVKIKTHAVVAGSAVITDRELTEAELNPVSHLITHFEPMNEWDLNFLWWSYKND